MGIDMFRLNALIDLLLWEGEDYDPAIARELFEALPLERPSRFEFHWLRNRKDKGIAGLTNVGATFAEDGKSKTERISFWASSGTWVGKWRAIKTQRSLIIEPRFLGEIGANGGGDFYELPFKRGEPQILYKSEPRQVCIPIPFIGEFHLTFYRLIKWKSPAKTS